MVLMADVRPYPEVGEVFELTLDGDAPENQPLEMVRRDGYDPVGWQHQGLVFRGRHTQYFELVNIGYCHDLYEVQFKLAPLREIQGGQWREAFKTIYPDSDGKGSVGFADASWRNPNGNFFFPFVNRDGYSGFDYVLNHFNDDWRWLKLVPAKTR
jgi:hypothetical protein